MTKLIRFILILFTASTAASSPAQHGREDRLAAIAWLSGPWAGVGEGRPGSSTSTRHAERIQGGRFIRIEGRSVYPPQDGNSAGEIHSSLDVWSFDRRRNLLVLRQFDSLGFVSTYVQDRAASANGRIVLNSEQFENVPAGWRGRYTYEHPAADEYRELFELDTGNGFETYVSNRFLRSEGARPPS